MAELIDISNDKFWDILFDEACVEGQQAERIEKALKQISTTEAEIRAKAIDEFAKVLEEKSTLFRYIESEEYGMLHYNEIYTIAEQLKEE